MKASSKSIEKITEMIQTLSNEMQYRIILAFIDNRFKKAEPVNKVKKDCVLKSI